MKDLQGMIRRNYQLSRQLTPLNEAIYTDMVCYLRTSALDDCTVEEMIQEILGIFVDTQARGEKIEQVIGSDYRAFCDRRIAEVLKQPRRRQQWQKHLAKVEIGLNALILLWLIDLAFEHLPRMVHYKNILLSYQVNAAFLVNALLIILVATFATNYIGKNSFSLSANKEKRKKIGLISGFAVGTLFALFILISRELSAQILFTTKLHYIAATLAAVMLILKGIQGINNIKS